MFLRAGTRPKDGKLQRCWCVVASRRGRGGRLLQRRLLRLGELNDSQPAGWAPTIETLSEDNQPSRRLALFPADRDQLPSLDCEALRIRVAEMQLRRPRRFGACWPALHPWNLLALDELFEPRLPPSRQRTRWANVLKA